MAQEKKPSPAKKSQPKATPKAKQSSKPKK